MLAYKQSLTRPYPDRALYDQTLAQGFRQFPQREENYRRYKLARRGITLDYLPIKLDIENVSRCNFHCTMCQVSDWPGFKRSRDMTLDEYRALLDEQIGLTEIKLQGMGEPLIGGETYFSMIRIARERSIWVRSVTNGSLLNVKDNYKKVIDADISELHVSIDGATAPTYEAIRRGGKFGRTCEGAKLLNGYARSQNRMRTRMWTVVQAGNFPELEQLPVLAAELGFHRLSLSLDLNDWGQDAWREKNDTIDKQEDFSLERAQNIEQIGLERGVEVTFWHIDAKYDTQSVETLCPWPFERAYISSEMRIVPCCMVANPSISDLGDAAHFARDWNGPAMQAFRSAHLKGEIPKFCQSCYRKA
jgi:MoaA/NifB/PqqE/SkfB family radical SAM enzyme